MKHLQSIDEVMEEFNIDNFTHFDSGDMVVDGEGIKNWLRTTLTTREQAIREEEQSESYAQGWNEGQQAITKKMVEALFNLKEIEKDWQEHFYESDWSSDTLTKTKLEQKIEEELGYFLPRHMIVYDWNLPYIDYITLVFRKNIKQALDDIIRVIK